MQQNTLINSIMRWFVENRSSQRERLWLSAKRCESESVQSCFKGKQRSKAGRVRIWSTKNRVCTSAWTDAGYTCKNSSDYRKTSPDTGAVCFPRTAVTGRYPVRRPDRSRLPDGFTKKRKTADTAVWNCVVCVCTDRRQKDLWTCTAVAGLNSKKTEILFS